MKLTDADGCETEFIYAEGKRCFAHLGSITNMATIDGAAGPVAIVGADVGTMTHAYDANCSFASVPNRDGSVRTVSRDENHRVSVHLSRASVATYLYGFDGPKRVGIEDSSRTTPPWDGTDHLQGRS